LFKAILPDPKANEFISVRAAIAVIAEKIRSLNPDPDITDFMATVEELLDSSVAAEGYVIPKPNQGDRERVVDLSKIDFDALKERFEKARKRTEAEKLRSLIERKLYKLVRANKMRMNFQQRFQEMIDDYNLGAVNVEAFFDRLVIFAQELTEEEKRTISENLDEEELAIFDILTRPDLKLTEPEKKQVKKAAKDLLTTLKAEKLVLDWRKRQQSRAQVMVTIEEVFDKELPNKFNPNLYRQKCELVYQHVYDSYFGEGRSVYGSLN